MVHGAVSRGKRVIFVTRGRALVHDMSDRVSKLGIAHGVLMGGKRRELGPEHVSECWKHGVLAGEPSAYRDAVLLNAAAALVVALVVATATPALATETPPPNPAAPSVDAYLAEGSVASFRINNFLHELIKPEFRKQFLADPEPLFDAHKLPEQEREPVNGCHEHDGHCSKSEFFTTLYHAVRS